jgi:hypothetical protein
MGDMTASDAPHLTIAGRLVPVETALETLAGYPAATTARYDLPGPGDRHTLTADEVLRTRVINSRIGKRETEWFVSRAAEGTPWVPTDAGSPEPALVDADPAEIGDLYDAATRLYDHFRGDRPRGVNLGKISKVLHVKYPGLYPILDTRLQRTYRLAARRAAARYPDRGFKFMYWAAIRDDLLINRDNGGLEALHLRIRDHPEPRITRLTAVTDLRLLDMLTWS